ncbi:PssD/Cps14F family polysaccharide biosynthesis glycosyltransferase [Vibrio cyclitrophicus]
MKILVVYGCGGHSAQANRLTSRLSNKENIEFFSITDKGEKPAWSICHIEVGEVRDKKNGSLKSLVKLPSTIWAIYSFMKKNKIKNVLSTGPGVSLLVAVISRVCRCKVIHIETWSRFYSLSLTGKAMRLMSIKILFQNKELSKCLKNSQYVGRL